MVHVVQQLHEVAAQLRSCVQSWACQLQPCLDGRTTASSELPVDGADTTNLEMCLAQIETTLTNIDSLNWAEATDIVLNALDRETDTLEMNQRRASCANRPTGRNLVRGV